MASFLRICENEVLETEACATSQSFYIIRGGGSTDTEHGVITWNEGDLFVLPASEKKMTHSATADTAIYWVTDEPLLKYLGVKPNGTKFNVTLFRKERMLAEVERIKHQPGSEHRNRMGILLGNKITEDSTKTLTHVLWSLLNVLPAGDAQRPHRHNSVALDLCVASEPEGVYTLMGPELDDEGWVKNPIKCQWKTGAVFTTPPGWWYVSVPILHNLSPHISTDNLLYPHAGIQRILSVCFYSRHEFRIDNVTITLTSSQLSHSTTSPLHFTSFTR